MNASNDSSSLGRTSRKTILLLAAFPLSDITLFLTYNTPIVKLLTQNLLDVVIQLSSPSDSTRLEQPDELLLQRLTFLSELLMLCKSSADCKDNPQRALVLREALLQQVLEVVLQGYFEVELMSIRWVIDDLLTLSNTRIVASTRILRLILSQLLRTPASPLIDLIASFVCGEKTRQPLLFPTLLSRINNNSNDVSIATMQLFDVLLKSQHPVALSHLLLRVRAESVDPTLFFQRFSDQFVQPLPYMEQLMRGHSLYQQDVEYAAAFTRQCRRGREGSVENEKGDNENEKGSEENEKGDKKNEVGDKENEKGKEENENTNTRENEQNAISILSTTPSSSQSEDSTAFLTILRTRVQMMLRQAMEVNLQVTQLVTTIATIAPLDLFITLFLDAESPISMTKELNTVGMEGFLERRCGRRQSTDRKRLSTLTSIWL